MQIFVASDVVNRFVDYNTDEHIFSHFDCAVNVIGKVKYSFVYSK